ncbi:neprilysin-2-like isoform X4 [Microplitis mediator]|uniref:neprilysin-2-like isoform X4 n=1 Tax=Microplitis mediator TaxID=375433 RepID=UPI002555A44D|nr:neprilysin-2-like isoform X4 [Microplitis mediator]
MKQLIVMLSNETSRQKQIWRIKESTGFGSKLFVIAIVGFILWTFLTNTSAAIIDRIKNNGETKKYTSEVFNEAYLETTDRVKRNLDTNINPCDNFHSFVCGNSKTLTFSEIKHLKRPINEIVHDLIQRGTGSVDFKPFKLIDDLYITCMRNEVIGQQALDLLTTVLKRLDKLPLMEGDKWKESNFDWIDFTIESKKIGINSNNFLDFETLLYPEQDKLLLKYMIQIPPQVFKKNISNSLIIAYTNYIAKTYTFLGYKQESLNEIYEIIEFERRTSEIYIGNYKTGNSVELTFEELTKEFPSINWHKLINNVIINNLKTQKKISEITLWSSNAVFDFIELLKTTPKRVQENYAVWKIIQNTIPYLTENYRELKREYCLTQKCKTIIRADSCVGIVQRYLAPALNLLYAKSYYSSDIDKAITDTTTNIKSQLMDSINKSTWMNQDTKKEGIEIIKNTPFIIGYAEKNNSDDEFIKYYMNLELDDNNYFQTLLNLELFDIENKFDNVTSLGAKNFINPVSVDVPINTFDRIDIPMAMIRKPFFDVKYPMYMNYGDNGRAIANELIQNIGDLGEKQNEYNGKISCFQNQFENFTSKELVFYPTSLLITAQITYETSYRAYQQWITKNGIELPLSGQPYSNNQLFWIHSLQNLCTFFPKESKLIDNKYTLFEFHSMKAITSVPEFYDDFNCPIDNSFVKNYGPACTFL